MQYITEINLGNFFATRKTCHKCNTECVAGWIFFLKFTAIWSPSPVLPFPFLHLHLVQADVESTVADGEDSDIFILRKSSEREKSHERTSSLDYRKPPQSPDWLEKLYVLALGIMLIQK